MNFCAIAALIASPAGPIISDGDQAYQAAERILARLNVRGARNLTTVGEYPTGTWNYSVKTYWLVAYTTPSGKFIQLHLSPEGRLLTFYHTYGKESDWPKSALSRVSSVADKQTSELLFTTFDHKPARLRSIGYGQHVTAATYDLIYNGMTFFNLNPHIGYDFTWDRNSKEMDTIMTNDVPPPVDSNRPKIPMSTAEKRFRAYVRSNPKSDGSVRVLQPDWPQRMELRYKLGYFKFEGNPIARLVWEARLVSTENGPGLDCGCLNKVVDAITGDLLEVGSAGIN